MVIYIWFFFLFHSLCFFSPFFFFLKKKLHLHLSIVSGLIFLFPADSINFYGETHPILRAYTMNVQTEKKENHGRPSVIDSIFFCFHYFMTFSSFERWQFSLRIFRWRRYFIFKCLLIKKTEYKLKFKRKRKKITTINQK